MLFGIACGLLFIGFILILCGYGGDLSTGECSDCHIKTGRLGLITFAGGMVLLGVIIYLGIESQLVWWPCGTTILPGCLGPS